MPNLKIRKSFRFEAAHWLPNVPAGHKCGRMHGHSFLFWVEVEAPVSQPEGWVMDFGDISSVVKPIIEDQLDHYTLNEVPGLENPTAEQLCVWLYNRIKPLLPALAAITVAETCTTEAEYRP